MSDLFSSLKISGSGLSTFRRKMNVVAENLANAETTKTAAGGPYQKKTLKISAKPVPEKFAGELKSAAVSLTRTDQQHISTMRSTLVKGENVYYADGKEVVDPNQEQRMVYDPSHPDANEDGFVAMPDIDPLIEMVEMMAASRAYEANLAAIQSAKTMTTKALDI
jgi:flagellar basal-body rod protein FlgC